MTFHHEWSCGCLVQYGRTLDPYLQSVTETTQVKQIDKLTLLTSELLFAFGNIAVTTMEVLTGCRAADVLRIKTTLQIFFIAGCLGGLIMRGKVNFIVLITLIGMSYYAACLQHAWYI